MSAMQKKTATTVSERATEKVAVYEALTALNQGFAQVLQHLHRLGKLGVLRREFFTGLQATVEETRAWANFEVLGTLRDREEINWARFGRLRQKWEKI